ncbi:hypothetical protein [Halobacterium wangiae]|uniref:hypothetical protein n=1 Tax=Halobacterium wangiae TaxID=2902623 RepID=UPI001E318801|nr:hypothetical protein [Halobacterium wangiae]
MTDWERVKGELREAGYPGFEFDSGRTAVPGLRGEWVVGEATREGGLMRENQSLLLRIFDALPGSGGAVTTDPEATPDPIGGIADDHCLDVVIVSVREDAVRLALCDPREENPRP